jgi:hypothetical protein
LILPGVNGFALARMARMRSHNLRIIYLTGTDDVPITKPTDQYSTSRSTRPCCCQRSGIACAQPDPTGRDCTNVRCKCDVAANRANDGELYISQTRAAAKARDIPPYPGEPLKTTLGAAVEPAPTAALVQTR